MKDALPSAPFESPPTTELQPVSEIEGSEFTKLNYISLGAPACSEQVHSAEMRGLTTHLPQGKKLGHMDFVPRVLRTRVFKPDIYESFGLYINNYNIIICT